MSGMGVEEFNKIGELAVTAATFAERAKKNYENHQDESASAAGTISQAYSTLILALIALHGETE